MASTTSTAAHPATLVNRALAGATNDQTLEIALKVICDLADRAERAADIAIDSDDRDAENEALVFAHEVSVLIPTMSGNSTLSGAWHKAHDAGKDLERAIQNRRAKSDGRVTRVEQFSSRRQARVASAYQVQRRREAMAAEDLVSRANITPERVLAAVQRVRGSEFQAKHVALALMPELADTSIPGRQKVINRVGMVLGRLAGAGQLHKHVPDAAKERSGAHRYSLGGEHAD